MAKKKAEQSQKANTGSNGVGMPTSILSKSSDSKETRKQSESSETVTNVVQFLKEVAIESRKISWPERSQVIRETYSVLVLVAIITLLVLGFDWLVGHFVFGPLEHWARLIGGGIGK